MKSETPSITVERLIVGQMASNCYLLVDQKTKDAIIIDPGDDGQYIIEKLEQLKARPKAILATHGHFDHIMAGRELEETYHIPFLIHEADVFLVDRMKESITYFLGIDRPDPPPIVSSTFTDGATISYGQVSVMVLHVPGHTPGSVCFTLRSPHVLFVGDTIFAGGAVGRTDFQYSEPKQFKVSLGKVLALDGQLVVYPGHGEATTIGNEKPYIALQYGL